jgi:hypothetical protein
MLYRNIQTRAEGESLYIRYNTDANVVNDLKNDSSYEFIGEVILKINEKIKVKVYVNQHESVSHIQIRHAYDFSLCFLHELLMSFLITINKFLTNSSPPRYFELLGVTSGRGFPLSSITQKPLRRREGGAYPPPKQTIHINHAVTCKQS